MFKEAISNLKDMSGCHALVLSDNTGETINFFENKKDVGIKKIAKDINSVFEGMHLASEVYQLGSINTIQVSSDESLILSVCSGEKERIHVHIFALFEAKMNIALAKRAVDDALKSALVIANA